jgi:hypothetical protein
MNSRAIPLVKRHQALAAMKSAASITRSSPYFAAMAIIRRPPANIARPANLIPMRARLDGSVP